MIAESEIELTRYQEEKKRFFEAVEKLKEDRERFENDKKSMEGIAKFKSRVTLNVGGCK
jgi:hypothetical protein